MTGGTPNHNQIALNLSGTLNFATKGRAVIELFIQRFSFVRLPSKRVYTYPDVMLVGRGNWSLLRVGKIRLLMR